MKEGNDYSIILEQTIFTLKLLACFLKTLEIFLKNGVVRHYHVLVSITTGVSPFIRRAFNKLPTLTSPGLGRAGKTTSHVMVTHPGTNHPKHRLTLEIGKYFCTLLRWWPDLLRAFPMQYSLRTWEKSCELGVTPRTGALTMSPFFWQIRSNGQV